MPPRRPSLSSWPPSWHPPCSSLQLEILSDFPGQLNCVPWENPSAPPPSERDAFPSHMPGHPYDWSRTSRLEAHFLVRWLSLHSGSGFSKRLQWHFPVGMDGKGPWLQACPFHRWGNKGLVWPWPSYRFPRPDLQWNEDKHPDSWCQSRAFYMTSRDLATKLCAWETSVPFSMQAHYIFAHLYYLWLSFCKKIESMEFICQECNPSNQHYICVKIRFIFYHSELQCLFEDRKLL